ncbi:MAG: hypothetical protein WCS52_07810 [bacterium]
MGKPCPRFMEGALLGNGALGVVVCTRPDAVVLRFGHNNVWDIRIAEENWDKVRTFEEIFGLAREAAKTGVPRETADWDQYYTAMLANMRFPYPRPYPCGSLVLGFDRREAELLGHRLDPATGLCEVFFLVGGCLARLEIFTDMEQDRVWLRFLNERGQPMAAPFNRVNLIPEVLSRGKLPAPLAVQGLPMSSMAFRQRLCRLRPGLEEGHAALHSMDGFPGSGVATKDLADSEVTENADPRDKMVQVTACFNGQLQRTDRPWIDNMGSQPSMDALERALPGTYPFVACVQLDEGLATRQVAPESLPEVSSGAFAATRQHAVENWDSYWSKSAVSLDDEALEAAWYRNLYFMHCAVRPGVTCPGLYANWSYGTIGSCWHGDYHMDYNAQQPNWGLFTSNHADKHLPYVDLVEKLVPLARRNAREYYQLRGAAYPHTAFGVEMTIPPSLPVPDMGWMMCETPWTVQSLWWHYRYTLDREFLAQRAFVPIREAVLFLVDYLKRQDAHGPQWGDEAYHVFPTVPPELYCLKADLSKNRDCIADLTLITFLFRAYGEACKALECEQTEAELLGEVREILEHFPAYPTADSPRGTVFVTVPSENPEIVQNCPVSLMPVFPGEAIGLATRETNPRLYEIAANTYRNQRNEGGNELVFLNMQAARLGLLDLERFKRQLEYCRMPNGSYTDMVLQVGGRYSDRTPFEFMDTVGVWYENFAVPGVINECLLQSHDETLRVFPNWPHAVRAEFTTLRAKGAFLVSAACNHGAVEWIEVLSEAGQPLRIHLPWPDGARCQSPAGELTLQQVYWETTTLPGDRFRFTTVIR